MEGGFENVLLQVLLVYRRSAKRINRLGVGRFSYAERGRA